MMGQRILLCKYIIKMRDQKYLFRIQIASKNYYIQKTIEWGIQFKEFQVQVKKMSIEELQLKMKKLVTQIQPMNYNLVYKNISRYVKFLRHQKIPLNQENFSYLQNINKLILNFLENKNSSDNPLFLQALITLDNTFNLCNNLLKNIVLSKDFFININRFFLHTCMQADQAEDDCDDNSIQILNCKKIKDSCEQFKLNDTKKHKVNFELYSVLYLIVMLIYQTNRREDHLLFKKYLLNQKFLSHFFSLEIANNNKTEKLIGIILTYLVKTINFNEWKKSIKRFILTNISVAFNPRIQFYFFYSLRCVKDIVSLSEIKKFNLLKFLGASLNSYSGTSQAYYIYDILSLFLNKYPILGYNILTINIFEYLQKDLLRYQNQIFKIFQKLNPCIAVAAKNQSLLIHIKRFSCDLQNSDSLKILSLKMISILLKDSSIQQYIEVLRSQIINYCIEKITDNPSSSEEKVVINFLKLVLEKLIEENQNVANSIYNKILFHKGNIIVTAKTYQFFSKFHHHFKQQSFQLT